MVQHSSWYGQRAALHALASILSPHPRKQSVTTSTLLHHGAPVFNVDTLYG